MFDLRYHVASLAAVFVALLIGILVGVGLTGKVDDAEKNALRSRAARAERQADALAAERSARARAEEAARVLAAEGYPLLMRDVLRGRRVGLLFLGSVDGDISDAVAAVLEDAGARPLTRMRALTLPLDAEQLESALGGSRTAGLRGEQKLRLLGSALAEEFVNGGDAPTWAAVDTVLIEERSGRAGPPVDGVVVARTVAPQSGATAHFVAGVYDGLDKAGLPVVGVETSTDDTSAIEVFERAGLSTVDNVDTETGRLALALLLAGAAAGNYGVKETADDILPEVARGAGARG